MFCIFSTELLLNILSVVNECAALHSIQKFRHFPGGAFFSKCNENLWRFTENLPTRKLGEISVLNAVQELNFSKLVRLQLVTVQEIELHSFFSLLFSRAVGRMF